MTIETLEIAGKGTVLDPAVLVSGMQVTVGPGMFRLGGQDYELTEEVNATFDTESHRQLVLGYLAREVATGDITVVYDVEGPDDEAYIQGQPGDPYEFLECIVIIDIPADTTDLDLVTVKVKRAVEAQDGEARS